MTVINVFPTPKLQPNLTMFGNGCENEAALRPVEVAAIPLEQIEEVDANKRMRPFDRTYADALREDIRKNGLLQPIGVRASTGSNGPYKLIYGLHRFVAMCELNMQDTEHKHQRGVIPAIVFPSNMTDDQIKMAEATENLTRLELTAAERGAHEAIYAGLLKNAGAVVTHAEKSRKGARLTNDKKRGRASGPTPTDQPETPTVTEALQQVATRSPRATGTEADAKTIRKRFAAAKQLSGVETDKTLESATGDELIEIGEKALKNAKEKRSEIARNVQDGAKRRPDRIKAEPDIELAQYILKKAERHGWPVVQKAIQLAWRTAEAPDGRVVFNTAHGPAAEEPRDRSHLSVVKSA